MDGNMAKRIRLTDYIDEKELQKMVGSDLRERAEAIIDDMRKYTFQTMWEFYMDYYPHKYRRLYSLIASGGKKVGGNTFPHATIKKRGNGYQIQLTYDSSIMKAMHNDGYEWGGMDRGDLIFNGPFVRGYHGGPIFTVDSYKLVPPSNYIVDQYHYEPAPQMIPSPWERIFGYAQMQYNGYLD